MSGGIIQSPNYPFAYPNSYSCSWIINVPEKNKAVLLFVKDFWVKNVH